MSEQIPTNTSEFLTEQIKSRPINRRRILRRVIEVAALAILFGLISCVTMVYVAPFMEAKLFPTPTDEVTFAEESASHISEEVSPEDMILEDESADGMPETPDSEVQLYEMAFLLKQKARECKPWLVKVAGQSSETSWLQSTQTSANVATGAIVADNGLELLILVEQKGIAAADSIIVTFDDGTSAEAVQKGQDDGSGLMVVAVAKEGLADTTLQACEIAKLASSNNRALLGSVAIALGSPNGVLNSVSYGFISAMGVEANSWDVNYKLFMTDIYGSSSPEGFLINLKGQIIGVLCNDYNASDCRNLVSAMGISELKGIIEKMSNGERMPYLGIKGTDVTKQAHQQKGIPYGAYVTAVKMDSPAMQEGVQAGDVIVKLDGREVSNMNIFSSYLQQLEVGSKVEVVIMRQSQGVYKESLLEITLGSR